MSRLKLHDFSFSPNSVKVRIGLGYKGLEYERLPFEVESFPGDRTLLLELSGQPRAPVLEDGETVIFDSRSILRYLEANFRDTPRLFVDDREEHGEIESWETFALTEIGEPIGAIFGQAFAEEANADVIATANRLLNERTGVLEERLSGAEFLVGEHLTAADIGVAAPLYLTDLAGKNVEGHPVFGFFQQNLRLGDDRETTRAWVRKVMAHDPVMGSQ